MLAQSMAVPDNVRFEAKVTIAVGAALLFAAGLWTLFGTAQFVMLALVAGLIYLSNEQQKAAKEARRMERAADKRAGRLQPEDIIVIGAGFSGICSAIKLQEAGLPCVVLEKADGIGGTWKYNTYPGAACDITAHLYQFSFALSAEWTKSFAPQHELLAYLNRVVDEYELADVIRCNCEVVSAVWDEEARRWKVETADGQTFSPRFLINAVGFLHQPRMPNVPGIDTFEGPSFHTANWDSSVDLEGKNVVIVGTGASAIQVVPEIAEATGKLTILQRSANWVSPKFDYLPFAPKKGFTKNMRWVLENVPGLLRLYYLMYYVNFDLLVVLGIYDRSNWVSRFITRDLEAKIKRPFKNRPDLLKKVLPDYSLGCRRILRSDTYLTALTRDNVDLLCTSLAKVVPDGVVTADGEHVPADVIIYATGFDNMALGERLHIQGRSRNLENHSITDEGVEAFLGASVRGLPNSFMLLGPNTILGHSSVILMLEAQVEYMVRMICEAVDDDVASFEIKKSVMAKYSAWLEREFAPRVFMEACGSWYTNDSGKNVAIWPSTVRKFWQMTRGAPSLRRSYDVEYA